MFVWHGNVLYFGPIKEQLVIPLSVKCVLKKKISTAKYAFFYKSSRNNASYYGGSSNSVAAVLLGVKILFVYVLTFSRVRVGAKKSITIKTDQLTANTRAHTTLH